MDIFEILLYVCFAVYSSSLAKKSQDYINDNYLPDGKWDKYLINFLLLFSIIGGIRWRVSAVVVKDIPDTSVAVCNPAPIIKRM